MLSAVLALGPAGPAWAHGELKPDRVAKGATAQLDLVLPSEIPGSRTTRVVLAMPQGFTARSCEEPVGWTCAVAADAVEWRDVARVRAEVDFLFTATASSTPGTYTLPVEQTYDDGTVNTFAGEPGSDDEAPVLTVTGAAPPATTARPSPTRTASARPSATVTSAPSASVPASATAGAPTSGAASSAPATSTPSPVASATAFARPSSLPRGELLGGGDDPSGGRLLPVLLAGSLVVLLGAAVASRRSGRG